MKKSFLCLLLAVLMVFGMFPFGAFAVETDTADAAAAEDEAVGDEIVTEDSDLADTGAYSITGPIGVKGVVEPVAGSYPSYTGVTVLDSTEYKINTNEAGKYKNGIMWKDENGTYLNPSSLPTFQAGKKYSVVISLLPASSSYQWDKAAIKSKTNTVNGNAAKVGFWDSGGMYLEYQFTALGQLSTASATVTAPVPGEAPDYSVFVGNSSAYYAAGNDSYWKNGVEWQDENGSAIGVNSGTKFVEGKSYSVLVALRPQSGYRFAAASSMSGFVNGYSATVKEWTQGTHIYLKKTFTCTKVQVNFVYINVTEPKPGYNPSFGASTNTTGAAIESDYNNSTTGYISGVQWKDESGNTLKLTSKFVAGKRYTVTVSVLRKSEGYEFSSSTKGYINYNTGTVSSWGGVAISVNLKVSYTFTCTATKITSAGLTGVPTPAAGTYPVYTGISVTGTGYHIDTTYDDVTRRNGIAWVDTNINKMMKSTEVFEAGHVYTINVILASNTGYEFAVSGSSPDVTVKFGGKEATGTNSVSGKEPSQIMAAWYTFPALPGIKITSASFSDPPAPIAGQTPVYTGLSVTGTGYHIDTTHDESTRVNGIRWTDSTNNAVMKPTDKFEAGNAYTCNVLIAPDTGYEFAVSGSDPAVSVTFGSYNATDTNKTTLGDASQSMAAWLTFPALSPTAVSAVSASVNPPAVGYTPSYSTYVNGDGYYLYTGIPGTGGSKGTQWYDVTTHEFLSSGDTFAAGHQYRVIVYLRAIDGYVFKNDGSKLDVAAKINGITATARVVSGYDMDKVIGIDYNYPALEATGFTVSGSLTSYISDSDKITIGLYKSGSEIPAYSKIVNGNANSYSVDNVTPGTYTMKVGKKDHTTREYTIKVTNSNVTQNVAICPKGDVNLDGETDIRDCSLAQRYIRELTELDPYQIACGDVSGTGDGYLDIQDVSRILRHIRELALLY